MPSVPAAPICPWICGSAELVIEIKAELDEARLNLRRAEVKAPDDGIVSRVDSIRPGDFVRAGVAAFSYMLPIAGAIADRMDRVKLTVLSQYIAAGQSAALVALVTVGDVEAAARAYPLLRERLEGKIDVDFDTARRLFTLISVLHLRG